MLSRIISGWHSGTEQAARRAAKAFGIATAGMTPRTFLTEAGRGSELEARGEATKVRAAQRLKCIEQNVHDSDATLWIGETTTREASAAVGACQRLGKPCMPVYPDAEFEPAHVADWIAEHQIKSLHVTGTNELEQPGIGERVERFMGEVLERLGRQRA
jgi:hypothetical protein